MKLSAETLTELKDLAESAAKKAGALINTYSAKSVNTSYKNSGNTQASQIVTEVDHLCEAMIIDHLQSSIDAYDLGLLTEEQEDDKTRLEKDYFWCIDPLDGTLAFTESKPGYAVSIALVSQTGEPCIGVVYDPVQQTLYSAVKDQGAYRNGEPWTLANDASNSTFTKTITIPFDRSLRARIDIEEIKSALTEKLKAEGYSEIVALQHGGAVMNACWALESTPSCYFKFPKLQEGGGSLWDFAATACFYNEFNLPVCDAYGEALDLNKANTTYMNEHGVIFSSTPELLPLIQSIMIQFRALS